MKFPTIIGIRIKMTLHLLLTTMKIHLHLNQRRGRESKDPSRKKLNLVSFKGKGNSMHLQNQILTDYRGAHVLKRLLKIMMRSIQQKAVMMLIQDLF